MLNWMSHLQRVQSFESLLKKTKGFNSLSHFSRQDHVQKKKKGSISMSHVEKRVQFLWVMMKKAFNSVSCIRKKEVQFCEFNFKKFNSLSHFFRKKKGSVLLVTLKKFNSLSCIQRRFNSLSHFFWKRVQFFDFFFLEKRVTLKNGFDSLSHIQKKKFNSLSHSPKRGRFYSFSHAQNIQLFELHSKKVQSFESLLKKNKRVQFFESFFQTGSIISVSQNFCKRKNSISHVEKMGSIL